MKESSETAAPGDEANGPGSVLISLRIGPGEPISGTLTSSGQTGTSFCGWMELIAAISDQRERQS